MKEHLEAGLNALAHEFGDIEDVDTRSTGSLLNDYELGGLLDDHGVHPNAQERIVALQQEKAVVMETLHRELAAIDRGEASGDSHGTPLTLHGDTLCASTEGGAQPVSIGTLLTDAEWGQTYTLPHDAPRALKKRYAVERAKTALRELLDAQVLEELIATSWKRTAYGRRNFFKERIAERKLEEEPGLIAEKMLRVFLKRFSLDHDLGYEIVEADIYQDTVEKIDFIIRMRHGGSGVGVDAVPHCPEEVGVQFTTRTSELARDEKRHSLEEAARRAGPDALPTILVQLGVDRVLDEYRAWQNHKTPGGPENRWSTSFRLKVIERVFGKLAHPDELAVLLKAAESERPLTRT